MAVTASVAELQLSGLTVLLRSCGVYLLVLFFMYLFLRMSVVGAEVERGG